MPGTRVFSPQMGPSPENTFGHWRQRDTTGMPCSRAQGLTCKRRFFHRPAQPSPLFEP